MKTENNSEQLDSPSQLSKAVNLVVSEMLTPTEIEQLRQEKKEHNSYAKEAFSRLKQK